MPGVDNLVEEKGLPQSSFIYFIRRKSIMQIYIFKKYLIRFLQGAYAFASSGQGIDEPRLI